MGALKIADMKRGGVIGWRLPFYYDGVLVERLGEKKHRRFAFIYWDKKPESVLFA